MAYSEMGSTMVKMVRGNAGSCEAIVLDWVSFSGVMVEVGNSFQYCLNRG